MYDAKPPVSWSVLIASAACIALNAVTIQNISMGIVGMALLTLYAFQKNSNWYFVPIIYFGGMFLLGMLLGIAIAPFLH